jgi:hypothetical protein
MRLYYLFVLLLGAATPLASAWQTWCGKHYEQGAPHVKRTAQSLFKYPPISDVPLLDFHCVTASSLYISAYGDPDSPAVIIDANITRDIGSPCE